MYFLSMNLINLLDMYAVQTVVIFSVVKAFVINLYTLVMKKNMYIAYEKRLNRFPRVIFIIGHISFKI